MQGRWDLSLFGGCDGLVSGVGAEFRDQGMLPAHREHATGRSAEIHVGFLELGVPEAVGVLGCRVGIDEYFLEVGDFHFSFFFVG